MSEVDGSGPDLESPYHHAASSKQETTDQPIYSESARADQVINTKHDVVRLAGNVDWEWIDGEIAPLYSVKGRPEIATGFMINICGLSVS